MRTHSLTEYKIYLQNLRGVLDTSSDTTISENKLIFKKAKESMKTPGSGPGGTTVIRTMDDDEDYPFFSGGSSCIPDYESKEQSEAAKKVREFMDSQLQQNGLSVKGIDMLDRDKEALPTIQVNFNEAYTKLLAAQPLTTEAALQYMGGIQTFDEAQDDFFKDFLTLQETSLDTFFAVSSYDKN